MSSPYFAPRTIIPLLPTAMNPTPDSFTPPASLAEEWDNPAMAEFKRQEAEERVAFGCSAEARQWLDNLRNTKPQEVFIQLAPRGPKKFPFKPISLPW